MSNSGKWWNAPETLKYWAIISALSSNLLIWYKMMKSSWATVRTKEVNPGLIVSPPPPSTDIKERFTNCILLLIVCLRNMEQFSWNPGNSHRAAGRCRVVHSIHVHAVWLHSQTTCGCCSLMLWWCWHRRWQWMLSSTPSLPSSMTSVLMWVLPAPPPSLQTLLLCELYPEFLTRISFAIEFVIFNRFSTLFCCEAPFGQLSGFLGLQPDFSHCPRCVFNFSV